MCTHLRISGTLPLPVPDFGHVLTVGADVLFMGYQHVAHMLLHIGRLLAEARHPFHHIGHQMEPVEVVAHHHVERGARCPLFLVTAHMDIVVIGTPVGQAVDQPGIAVIGENDWAVNRENFVEVPAPEAVRMLFQVAAGS